MTAPHEPSSSANAMLGRISIVLAAVMWSSSGLFAKNQLFDSWPVGERGIVLAFWRALFAGALVLPLVRRPRASVWLVPMALCFTGMNVTYLQAMTRTTAANAIWLQSTAPMWVFVFGIALGWERAGGRDLVPLAFGLLGTGLILVSELIQDEIGSTLGVLCGLASGMLYAGVLVFIRRLRDQNSAWLVVVNHLTAAALLSPFALASSAPDAKQLATLACFGLVQMGLPYMLLARGLRDVSSQEGAAIGLLEPVLLPIWVYLAYGERPAAWTIAGGALILVGLAIRYALPTRQVNV
jgi:drug/metabolite transporter (DMT)-like permease